MKNFIKLLAVVLTAAMAIALLSSCGGKDSGAETATDAKETTETLTETKEEEQTGEVTEAETDEITAEEEQTTEAEVVTVEETDEETQPEGEQLYDVYRWDFNDPSNLGWLASNMTDILAEEDGSMHLVVKGGDPHITTKHLDVSIDCDIVEYVVIRVMNNTDSYGGQLFISTTDSPGPDENYSYKFDYDFCEDDEWEIIQIDTLDIPGWTGTLRSLRFDYSDGTEGDCYVDYIALQTSDEKKAGSVETVELVDPRAGKSLLYKWDFTTLTSADIYLSSQPAETEAEGDEDDDTPDPRWRFSKGVEDAYVEGGHLVIKIGGQDPFMASPLMDTPFDCDAVSAVVIKACNKTDMNLAQFFFISGDEDNYSEAASVKFSFEHKGADNDVWEEIVINPKETKLWTDELHNIRIDPSEAWDGIVLIDSCELYG